MSVMSETIIMTAMSVTIYTNLNHLIIYYCRY